MFACMHVYVYIYINILWVCIYTYISIYIFIPFIVIKSCPTLCDAMDCSLRGFSVHGIFRARILE